MLHYINAPDIEAPVIVEAKPGADGLIGMEFAAETAPSPERYANRAVYFTDVAVRADSPFMKIEDTFGHVVGYTLTDSMSGHVALRRHLLPFRKAGDEPPLIATAALDPDAVGRLRKAFAAVEHSPELEKVRATLLLRRFAVPEPSAYDVFHGILAASEQHAGVW